MARPATPGIFISYRRDDTRADAGRLCDRLEAHFGDEQVFMDIDDLKPGQKFVDELNRVLDGCDVLIVLMGSGWLGAQDQNGSLRLMDEQDFVRREVLTALQRGIEIIPVLVNRTPMPTPIFLFRPRYGDGVRCPLPIAPPYGLPLILRRDGR